MYKENVVIKSYDDGYKVVNIETEKSVMRTRLALRYLQETGRLKEEIKC